MPANRQSEHALPCALLVDHTPCPGQQFTLHAFTLVGVLPDAAARSACRCNGGSAALRLHDPDCRGAAAEAGDPDPSVSGGHGRIPGPSSAEAPRSPPIDLHKARSYASSGADATSTLARMNFPGYLRLRVLAVLLQAYVPTTRRGPSARHPHSHDPFTTIQPPGRRPQPARPHPSPPLSGVCQWNDECPSHAVRA